jgi:hypothetical protein
MISSSTNAVVIDGLGGPARGRELWAQVGIG